MKYVICSVRDAAVEAFMRPFPAESEKQAVRSFSDECFNMESPFAKHPDDYTLYKVGEFDSETGNSVEFEAVPLARARS